MCFLHVLTLKLSLARGSFLILEVSNEYKIPSGHKSIVASTGYFSYHNLLLLKPYLIREQAAALVSMLGAQSPLAQHVISSDLDRLCEPAVEQRVVQWEGL